MEQHVLYSQLTPKQFKERLAALPVAYLPLGTLEWHGPHLPLGADALQAERFFTLLARRIGGIVLPAIHLGPDRVRHQGGTTYYGMDFEEGETIRPYPTQVLPGSAYWAEDGLFGDILGAIARNLARAGFRVLVAHGHGPSTKYLQQHAEELHKATGMQILTCWDIESPQGKAFMGDHAAANETSICQYLCGELVDMAAIAEGKSAMVGMAGDDPLQHASAALGEEIVHRALDAMAAKITAALKQENTTL